jgi:adenylate cyclase
VGAWEQVTPTAVHCIGFVDLVGSSQLVNRLEAGHLSRVMTEFERAASDLVTGRGNRVVKAIGDEVMYYTVEPAAACEIALDLIDAVEAHDVLGTARAGVNIGPVVWQDGDCYGPVVSLAARLVDEAEPGEVLVGSGVADALAGHEGLVAATAGRRRVKGFDDPVPIHRVSRRS